MRAAGSSDSRRARPRVLAPGAPEHPAANWQPLFTAAGLEPARLQPTEPLWTWLGTSDSRFAWTGTWPQSTRPLRVEAAALRGKPVGFALRGAWDVPGDQAGGGRRGGRRAYRDLRHARARDLRASAWLAWRNLSMGAAIPPTRRVPARCLCVSRAMALWLTTAHLVLQRFGHVLSRAVHGDAFEDACCIGQPTAVVGSARTAGSPVMTALTDTVGDLGGSVTWHVFRDVSGCGCSLSLLTALDVGRRRAAFSFRRRV